MENENFGKVLPPLRDAGESRFLLQEFARGNVPIVATDHAPHALEEKNRDYSEAPSGITGFGIHPLLLLNKAVVEEQFPDELAPGKFLKIDKVVKAMSENPARTFGLKAEWGKLLFENIVI